MIKLADELFRCIIPYTVNIQGFNIDLSEQIKQYVQSKRMQEVSKHNLVTIEDESLFFEDKSISKLGICTINPDHVLATGYFGECKDNGVEFIATKLAEPPSPISIPSIRFGCLVASEPIYSPNNVKEILFAHILAKRIIV